MTQCSGRGKETYHSLKDYTVRIKFTDQATAFHDVKRAHVPGKGAVINSISIKIFEELHKHGVKTHFIKKISENEQLCHEVKLIPLNVVIRNVASGSMSKRLGISEGTSLSAAVLEIYYKNQDLGNPLINEHHAQVLNLSTENEINLIREQAMKINDILKPFFNKIGIILVDFKIEFGRLPNGEIVMADEISPDKSRLWDMETGEHLDKDHFSRDLGDVKEAYEKILERLNRKGGNL